MKSAQIYMHASIPVTHNGFKKSQRKFMNLIPSELFSSKTNAPISCSYSLRLTIMHHTYSED